MTATPQDMKEFADALVKGADEIERMTERFPIEVTHPGGRFVFTDREGIRDAIGWLRVEAMRAPYKNG